MYASLSAASTKVPLTDTEMSDKIKKLRACHELWSKYSPRWKFYRDAYQGAEDFMIQDNLFKHQRENLLDYEDRLKRLHNLNYCEQLVTFFTNFIFSESINRDGGTNKEFYNTFVKDVNRKGDSLDDFMRAVEDDTQIFGMSYLLVDSPSIPVAEDAVSVMTKADERDFDIRPYWILVKPDEVINWLVDEFGVFQYLKRKQCMYEMGPEGYPVQFEKYTEFFPDVVLVTKVDITEPAKPRIVSIEAFPNSLGEIPIVVGRFKRNLEDPYVGLSFLRDFAYNQREIMNLTSLLDEFLYRQAFNILARETDGGVPLAEQDDGANGTSNVMSVPKGAHFPQYIAPGPDCARFFQDERQKVKNEMFLRASQDAVNELFNGEGSSGFSKAQSFAKTTPFISSRADVLEEMEHKAMILTMKWLTKTWDGKIKYKDRYEITNLTDCLTQFQILVRDFQIPSETFIKEELKRLVQEFDGKLSVDIQERVMADIDKMDFKTWMDDQKTALLGNAGMSPGAQMKPKDTLTIAEHAKEGKTSVTATKSIQN